MNQCIKSKPKSNWTNIRITVAKMLLDIFAVNISMSCPCILFSFTLKKWNTFFCVYTEEKKIAQIEFSITSCFHNEIICCINNFITNSLVIAIQWWFFCCSVGAHILYFTTAYAFFIYLNRIACHSNWPCFFFNSLACLLSSLLSKVF